ncbi:MAG: DUF3853 family protein [Muribaculaceae bacterium]|nr:DUF3853 family protein [Muribaculaceae bacterium]
MNKPLWQMTGEEFPLALHPLLAKQIKPGMSALLLPANPFLTSFEQNRHLFF